VLVSVIIPVFNRYNFIGETLNSLLNQTYNNWECIVVDDGSTDYIDELMEFYTEKDVRINFYRRPENSIKGANACRNYGFQISKGEYIQWLDSDDIMCNDKIHTQLEALRDESETTIATCKFGYFKLVNKDLKVRENIKTYQNFSFGNDLLLCFGKFEEYFPLHVYLTPRFLVEKVGGWNEDLEINQDGEFFSRILMEVHKVIFVESEVFYRIGESDSISVFDSVNKANKVVESWQLIEKNINQKNHPYIKQAKRVLYRKLKEKYPEVIRENFEFLKAGIPLKQRILLKYLH